jgi:hypothetical protein
MAGIDLPEIKYNELPLIKMACAIFDCGLHHGICDVIYTNHLKYMCAYWRKMQPDKSIILVLIETNQIAL